MKLITLTIMLFSVLLVFGQSPKKMAETSSKELDAKLMNWLKDLNEKGVEMTEDSIIISKEFRRVLDDENYRKIIYPDNYSWEITAVFLKNQMLKPAFWYFINLYGIDNKNKTLVIKSVLTYDSLFKMDQLMVNAFYTYAFMDPESSSIKDGKPEIIHPDILEAKLRNVTEIVKYILKYREQNKETVTKN